MSCKTVLFDVMGTLVSEPFVEHVPAALGMSLEEVIRLKHPRAWIDFELGRIDEEAFRRSFFADGRDYDHEGMKAAMVAAYAWIDGVEAIVQELHAVGHALHLLSNYPCWYALIEDKLKLSRYAKWSFVSCDMGVRKPDDEAYLLPARKLGLPPSELLFIDDRGVNCKAARALGMDTILFRGAAGLRGELQSRALL